MRREQLVRDVKTAALARMEDAARTAADFETVIKQWDHLDENRERRQRSHEVGRNEETIRLGYSDGLIFPIPFIHPAWREAINGEFLDLIYDNTGEMWQLIEDWDIAALVKDLTAKQKDVLFLSAVRLCTAAQIACYHDKTDRAVRKLLAETLDRIRDKLAPLIREQIDTKWPQMTLAKREFLVWYEKEKAALDKNKDG